MASVPTSTSQSKRRASVKAVPSVIIETDPAPDASARLEYIATAAYYKAAARGFVPGEEIDDWLEAEAEFEEREAR